MIAITGASGKLGGAVIEHLLQLASPSDIVACVREPAKASSIASRGVEVRRGDYDDRTSLVEAFRGADQLLIVSSSGIDHEKRVKQHCNAINAAADANVGHVYYTSLLPGIGSVAYVMKAHLETEAYLRASRLSHTVLKNGTYVEIWPQYLGDVSSGEAVVPNDGPTAWVARDDLAEGTAKLLTQSAHTNECLTLTGCEVLDIAAVANELSRVRGQHVVRRIVPTDEYVSRLIAGGKSDEFARQWATTYKGMARGEFGRTDSLLANLLGRPVRTFATVLASCEKFAVER